MGNGVFGSGAEVRSAMVWNMECGIWNNRTGFKMLVRIRWCLLSTLIVAVFIFVLCWM